MNEAERRALLSLKFDLAPTPDDVWRSSPFHVDELNRETVERVFEGVSQARDGEVSNPLGVVIQGQSGSGKTHMLGMVRDRTQVDGGYFFLVSLLAGKDFWESVAICMVDGLQRMSFGWPTQLKAFLRRLTPMLGLEPTMRDAIAGDAALKPDDMKAFVTGLRKLNRAVGQETQDTARGLVLNGSQDFSAQDLGYAYLNSFDLSEYPERADWGFGAGVRSPQLIVRDISRLLALTGSPTVIAIDQLDTLFAQSNLSLVRQSGTIDSRGLSTLGQVADGLLSLRDITRKALVVVACLPDTWKMIEQYAATPVPDRFRENTRLNKIPTPEIGIAIVRKRLDERYARANFIPPYPTWPIKESAFASVRTFTPRALLKRVEQHASDCVRLGTVIELRDLEEERLPQASVGSISANVGSDKLSLLDDQFTQLCREAQIDSALAHTTEDHEMPMLLSAGLAALISELNGVFKQDPPPSSKPSLHARLRKTLDEKLEDEQHWAFRAIATDHATAAQSRIRNACTIAGLDSAVPKRSLFLLRNKPWPQGPKTKELVDAFHSAGGKTLPISADDLRVFDALRVMHGLQDEHLAAWLGSRKPASNTKLFQEIFGSPADNAGLSNHDPRTPTTPPISATAPHPESGSEPIVSVAADPSDTQIRLGFGTDTGQAFDLELEALRKHMVIFAGSGSGKTVLIRRLVEECALKGVSAIVLDPNNDLARLGDSWPEPPGGWLPGDPGKAADYKANVEVVVWTPRIGAGRPLTFQPLPNLTAVRNDPDEFRAAIDIAAAALAPRAKVDTDTAKSQQGQAVLRDALIHYAKHGERGGLDGYVDLLAELPEGVTALGKGTKLASEMADNLRAAMVNDPLFGGKGTAFDPGELLRPSPGKRARVSVISMIGLNSDIQRQGFVNQLQMALFAWIKRNPARDQPLGGLFVMDEAQTLAPSQGSTPCTASTLALVSQARKYGLGLVFATQAPRGLHNQIPGNAATQFFGLLNSPIQVAAAREMAHAKGGSIPDISLLTAGNFYAASEGTSFKRIKAPNCLTHHPKAPLTPEEVIDRARN